MTASRRDWVDHFAGGAAANGVRLVATIGANEHLRHVRIVGSQVYQPYPTNVVSDNGCWFGVLAVFPAAAPVVPSFANSSTWRSGWWGRPVTDSHEPMWLTGVTSPSNFHNNFHIEFDYAPEGGGVAGGLYVGFQQMYVDANHQNPIVSYTTAAWGIQN